MGRNLFRLAALALFVVSSMTMYQPSLAGDEKRLRWILNGPAVQTFATNPDAQRFFAGASPYVVQRNGDATPLPPSWNAISTRIFTNYAALQRAFATERVGPEVKAILYDNEAWQFTPEDEQRDLAGYTKKVAELVHAHGLQLIVAPAVDLVRNLAPAHEARYDAYMRLNMAADAARYADVYEIQAQGAEAATNKYAQFVANAARQAREVNPKVIVLAGLSTNPSGKQVSAEAIVRAVNATRHVVDGYWLNVPAPSAYCPNCSAFRPDLALEALKRL